MPESNKADFGYLTVEQLHRDLEFDLARIETGALKARLVISREILEAWTASLKRALHAEACLKEMWEFVWPNSGCEKLSILKLVKECFAGHDEKIESRNREIRRLKLRIEELEDLTRTV